MISTTNASHAADGQFATPALVLASHGVPSLQDCDVHLWPFHLRSDEATLLACEGVLSPAERAQAARFAFDRDKSRYIVAHGVLRHLLSLYSGVEPADIAFEHAASGKPKLLPSGDASLGSGGRDLSFNLSHSHDRAMVGFCRGREIGVDLEMLRSEVDVLSLAESCFFGSEIAAIRGAPATQQRETFFRYWVAKEAVLKGEGIGLGYPLDRFEVRFDAADERAGYITSADTTLLRADWTIRVLRLAIGWPGAVAVRGQGWLVRVIRAGTEGRQEVS